MEIQNAKARGCKIKVSQTGIQVRHEVQGDLPLIQDALVRDGHWDKCKAFVHTHTYLRPRCKVIYGYGTSDPEVFIQNVGYVYGMHLITGEKAHYCILQGEDCMVRLNELKAWLYEAGHSKFWEYCDALYPWDKVHALYEKKDKHVNVYLEISDPTPLSAHMKAVTNILLCSSYLDAETITHELSNVADFFIAAYGFAAHSNGKFDVKVFLSGIKH